MIKMKKTENSKTRQRCAATWICIHHGWENTLVQSLGKLFGTKAEGERPLRRSGSTPMCIPAETHARRHQKTGAGMFPAAL